MVETAPEFATGAHRLVVDILLDMSAFKEYLEELHRIRASGIATNERSYYTVSSSMVVEHPEPSRLTTNSWPRADHGAASPSTHR